MLQIVQDPSESLFVPQGTQTVAVKEPVTSVEAAPAKSPLQN